MAQANWQKKMKERDEILKLVRAHMLEIVCSYGFLDLPRTSANEFFIGN